jgi:uncharacterized protein YigE (DUF2233 family)
VAAVAASSASLAEPKDSDTSCGTKAFEGVAFVVCRYRPSHDEIRLASRSTLRSARDLVGVRTQLGREASRVEFAMNAGMFDLDFNPLGLFIASGHVERSVNLAKGGGNFFLLPNGVFSVDGRGDPHIDAAWATQSGPLLVMAGRLNPGVSSNGTSLAIRNGVGVKDGEALFVISNQAVSFGRFARFLRDGLGCPDVLYLDGAVSSLWSPELGRIDVGRDLGTYVMVLRRR